MKEACRAWNDIAATRFMAVASPVVLPNLVDKVADEDKEYFLQKILGRIGPLEQVIEPKTYEKNLKSLRKFMDSLAQVLKDNRREGHDEYDTYFFGEFSYADLAIGGVLNWIQFSFGDKNAFGDNIFLQEWFSQLKKKVGMEGNSFHSF